LFHSVPRLVLALHELGVPTGLLTTHPDTRYAANPPYPVIYYRDCPQRRIIDRLPSPLNKPDIVVFNSTYIPVHAKIAAVCRQENIPYIICPRGGMTRQAQMVKPLKKSLGNLLFFRRMVRNAAALHYLTEGEAIDSQQWKRPSFVVGNGMDLPSVEARSSAPGKAGLEFIFVGRLSIFIKGLDLLLDACGLAQDKLRDHKAHIHLYGLGSANEQGQLKRIIADRQIQDIVRLEEPVFGDAKYQILRNADLFLHTSRFEGHPMGVLEALSYGVPCLLTPGTNMATEVWQSGAGWKVEPTADAIADGLCTVLASRSELQIKRQAARDLISRDYSWEQVGKRLLNEYQRILEGVTHRTH
jgi:glycosyltransferase involved in cell wall biosynthesis